MYNTRQKDDFHIDMINSEIGKRSIKYKGSKLWNDLPAELKEIQSLQSFKCKLKNHLLQSLTEINKWTYPVLVTLTGIIFISVVM